MAIPSHVSKRLRQALGPADGGDLVTWLDEMRAEHERFRADMLAMEARIVERMDRRFDKVDERFVKVDERLAGLQVAIADSKAELMKWSLLFWVGAVGAIAALAGVLRM
jgi:hypothetical protein